MAGRFTLHFYVPNSIQLPILVCKSAYLICLCSSQVKSGTLFDNILVSNDPEYAKKLAEETWGKNKDVGSKKFVIRFYWMLLQQDIYFYFWIFSYRLRRQHLMRLRKRRKRRYCYFWRYPYSSFWVHNTQEALLFLALSQLIHLFWVHNTDFISLFF